LTVTIRPTVAGDARTIADIHKLLVDAPG